MRLPRRPKGLQWTEWMTRTETRINAALDDLENNWMDTLADVSAGSIAVAVSLGYLDFRLGDLGWRNGRPKLAAWHEAFSKRDSMVKTALVPDVTAARRALKACCPESNFVP